LYPNISAAAGGSHDSKPGLASRIKEAIPGTHEHKEKAEREGDTAVYM
jgi:hypothetical protein